MIITLADLQKGLTPDQVAALRDKLNVGAAAQLIDEAGRREAAAQQEQEAEHGR